MRGSLAFIVMFFALCTSAHDERTEPYQGLVYCGYQRWADNECFMHCRTPQDNLGHYQCPTLGKAYRDLEPPQPNREVIQIGYGCYTSPSPADFYPNYSITVLENGEQVRLGRKPCGPVGNSPPPSMPMVSIDDTTVTEGPNGQAEFTVALSETSEFAVMVKYSTSGVTAMPDEDFAPQEGTLTIPPGESTGKIRVMVYDDDEVEETETFMVLLSDAKNAEIDDGDGVGTIMDDESASPALPTLSIDDAPVTEADNAEAVFTVTLSAESTDTVTVGYTTTGGTATEGDDYTGATGTVTIAAGLRTGTIGVPVLNDTEVESSETFTVRLSGPSNATILDGEGLGTIADDDEPPPLPTLSINDAPVTEAANAEAVFTVTLSAESTDTVTVGYTTTDGTATEGDDYTAATGTVTIAAGLRTGTIRVPVLNDTEVESSETFTVTLSGPSNATIEDGEGLGTITDDDDEPPPLPTLSINDAPVTEAANAEAVFTVTLSAESTDTVTVGYATTDGTATDGDDYTAATGTVTIVAGLRTGAIRVPVLNDTEVESSETFTVRLSGPSNATIQDGEGLGTITDDDGDQPPPERPSLSINDATVTEAAGAEAVFTVTLGAGIRGCGNGLLPTITDDDGDQPPPERPPTSEAAGRRR